MNTKQSRIRRARKTRAKIAAVKAIRLAIHRTNGHIYAQIISADGGTVMTSASSNDKELRGQLTNGGNVAAATLPPLASWARMSLSLDDALTITVPPSAEMIWA